MKTPIKPEDIRKGDLIRAEWDGGRAGRIIAYEYIAERRGDYYDNADRQFLLDRRSEPAVDLPTEPTLGWVDSKLGVWAARSIDVTYCSQVDRDVEASTVRDFTPATAVPTAALDALRSWIEDDRVDLLWGANARIKAARNFLAAVDEANGVDR